MKKFNVASINCCTESEGPYKRLTIWFQGCDIHCKGCCNPQFQKLLPNHIMALDEITAVIEKAKADFKIEGVTYTGGEPTLQQNLPYLTEKIKEMGLGVISFTGHLYEEVENILCGCDAVLDGAFDLDILENKRRLLGSKNQRILCLTDRYKDVIYKWFDDKDHKSCDVNVSSKILFNGDKI